MYNQYNQYLDPHEEAQILASRMRSTPQSTKMEQEQLPYCRRKTRPPIT